MDFVSVLASIVRKVGSLEINLIVIERRHNNLLEADRKPFYFGSNPTRSHSGK